MRVREIKIGGNESTSTVLRTHHRRKLLMDSLILSLSLSFSPLPDPHQLSASLLASAAAVPRA
eukprot:767509-Hanusia_phi.AAC.1